MLRPLHRVHKFNKAGARNCRCHLAWRPLFASPVSISRESHLRSKMAAISGAVVPMSHLGPIADGQLMIASRGKLPLIARGLWPKPVSVWDVAD